MKFLLYFYCTLVLCQDMQNKPNGSLCALLRSEAEMRLVRLILILTKQSILDHFRVRDIVLELACNRG